MKNDKTNVDKKKVLREFKRDKNRTLKVSLAIILAVYAFFFLSPYIFHQGSKAEYTPFNVEYRVGKTSVSIESWKYSKKQNRMELIINISNHSSEEVKYNYYAFCNYNEASKGKTQLRIDEKLKEINYAVLWIYNIPKDFNGCAVYIYETGNNQNNIILQTTKKTVENTNMIDLKTIEEYHITKYNKIINDYKKRIKSEKGKINNCNNKIKKYNRMIIETQKTEIYQSEEEIQNTEKIISSYRGAIDSLKSSINNSKTQIKIYQNEIFKYQKLINKIRKKEG